MSRTSLVLAVIVAGFTYQQEPETPEERTRWLEAQHEKNVCGNAVIDFRAYEPTPVLEDCDGLDLGGKDCRDFDHDAGILACNGDCTFNTSDCTDIIEPPPTTTTTTAPPDPKPPGTIATSTWTAIPNSEMNTIKNQPPGSEFPVPTGGWHATIDDQPEWGANNSWENIMDAESGGVCMGKDLYVWGGGHHDGAHNGILAIDTTTGKWRRVTPPTTDVWDGKCCPIVNGQFYTTNPDGSPAARHTYNLITGDPTGQSKFIYAVGGGIWPGGVGGARLPTSFRLDLANAASAGPPMWGWSNFADSPVAHAHGNLIWVENKLYQIAAGQGTAIYDVATNTWSARGSGSSNANSNMVYSPTGDKFYVAGGGLFYKIPRATFQQNGTRVGLPEFATIKTGHNMGGIYYPPEDLILFYDSEPPVKNQIMVVDPKSESTSVITPKGSPGTPLNESYGRFAYCGNRVVLVGGVDQPMYYLKLDIPEPPVPVCGNNLLETGEQCDDGNTVDGDGCSATCQIEVPPPEPDLPPESTVRWPVMRTPPGGSLNAFDSWVDQECGAPRASWPVYEIGPGKPLADTAALTAAVFKYQTNGVIKIHYRDTRYTAPLKVDNRKCVEVIGVPGPNGELPMIANVNATVAYKEGDPILKGGLIVRKVDVTSPTATSCIGVPNNRTFVAAEDSNFFKCGHHGMITASANYLLYVRVINTDWKQADSHLLYIDRVGRADIINNRCQSPGWGHCIRSVARWSHVEGNTVSNVELDGTVIPKWTGAQPAECPPPYTSQRCSIGMHPMEVYACSDGIVKNNTAIKWQAGQANGTILIRGRTDINYCDTEGKTADETSWIPMNVRDERALHPGFWDMVRKDVGAKGNKSRFAFNIQWEGNTTKTIGPNKTKLVRHLVLNSNYPGQDPRARGALKAETKSFVLSRPGYTCAQLSAEATNPEMKWLFDHVKPVSQNALCKNGVMPEYIPMPAPDNWFERQYVTWGAGNQTLVCLNDDPDDCVVNTYREDVQSDNKEVAYWHPPGNPIGPFSSGAWDCRASATEDYSKVCPDKGLRFINPLGVSVFYSGDIDEDP